MKRYSGNLARPAGGPLLLDLERAQPPQLPEAAPSEAPGIYRKLVDAAIPAIRANAVPDAKILVGELAPVGRAPKSMGPTEFLRKWLCLNKRLQAHSSGAGCGSFKKIEAQGFAHHPYGPTERVPKTRDVINMLAIRQLGKLPRPGRARRADSPAKLPIYNTEFGLQSNPPDRTVSTSLARQAALINEKEEYAYRYSRLKSHSQYLLLDDPARAGGAASSGPASRPGCASRTGAARPRTTPTGSRSWSSSAARGVSIWGRVRPGTGVRSVQLQKGGLARETRGALDGLSFH